MGSLVNNSPLRIDTRTAPSRFLGWFKSDRNELEIFNRVLTVKEVNAILKAGQLEKCK